MKKFNASVKESIPQGKFITALLLLLNKQEMEVTLINLGHLPPLYKAKSKKCRLLEFPGDILGVHENPEFGIKTMKVKKGDRFIIYTDGLLESNEKGIVWTSRIDQLPKILDEIEETPIQLLSETFFKKVRTSTDAPDDDILIMSIEI